MRSPKVIFLSLSTFILLAILTLCYRYNMHEDIGVNHGIMSLWFILFDSPIYIMAFVAPSITLWWLIHNRPNLIAVATVIQILLAFLIVDLHRWRYPSSISEETLSVFWSAL